MIKGQRKEQIRAVIFYIVFSLFILAFTLSAKNYDYDLWARLIAGMGFVQTGHVLKHDFLSYTPTHIWYDHEWGSSVIFYLVQHFFSGAGILILQAILTFLVYFMITKVVNLRGVKTTTAYNFLFYYFSFIAMSYILNDPVRCQMFSFLFFTVFLYILELSRQENNKGLFLIPLLMIIWNNLHGGCVSGLGLILLYIIGEFFNKKPVKKYILVLLASLIVLPLNPWGIDYLKFLYQANVMQRANIAEWFGIFSKLFMFKYMKFKIFALVVLLMEMGVIIQYLIKKQFDFDRTKFLTVTVTLILAIQHVKLIPFAVISMVCFFYDDFYSGFNGLTRNLFNKIANIKDAFVYFIILIFAFSNINTKAFRTLVDFSRYPILPVEFIKENKIKGNLLLNFGFSSYAIYKLYPQNKIYMDGRYEEVYDENLMLLLKNFYLGVKNWEKILKKYPPDVIIIEKFYPIYNVLSKDKNWTKIFEDNFFVVYVKKEKAKKTYKMPFLNLEYYRSTLFDTDINFMLKLKYGDKK